MIKTIVKKLNYKKVVMVIIQEMVTSLIPIEYRIIFIILKMIATIYYYKRSGKLKNKEIIVKIILEGTLDAIGCIVDSVLFSLASILISAIF